MTDCPNIGTYGHRCGLCGEFHYPAKQLPLYEVCDICCGLVLGATTFRTPRAVRKPQHPACTRAAELWWRDDNADQWTKGPFPSDVIGTQVAVR